MPMTMATAVDGSKADNAAHRLHMGIPSHSAARERIDQPPIPIPTGEGGVGSRRPARRETTAHATQL